MKKPYPAYPTPISDLIDRLSIVLMKSIFISEYKKAYRKEIEAITSDLDYLLQHGKIKFNADMILATLVTQLTNREIWLNESKARAGGSEQEKLLKFTHSVNGQRNNAKNIIAHHVGDRRDLKIDCLAAEFTANEFIKEKGDWRIYNNGSK